MTYIYSYNPQVFDAGFWVVGTLGLVEKIGSQRNAAQ